MSSITSTRHFPPLFSASEGCGVSIPKLNMPSTDIIDFSKYTENLAKGLPL